MPIFQKHQFQTGKSILKIKTTISMAFSFLNNSLITLFYNSQSEKSRNPSYQYTLTYSHAYNFNQTLLPIHIEYKSGNYIKTTKWRRWREKIQVPALINDVIIIWRTLRDQCSLVSYLTWTPRIISLSLPSWAVICGFNNKIAFLYQLPAQNFAAEPLKIKCQFWFTWVGRTGLLWLSVSCSIFFFNVTVCLMDVVT